MLRPRTSTPTPLPLAWWLRGAPVWAKDIARVVELFPAVPAHPDGPHGHCTSISYLRTARRRGPARARRRGTRVLQAGRPPCRRLRRI